mmetsp:Transcript_12720/g.15363  ORF Transcript_12720/g.15363 Transcript_12720/m.15363 type:complete len:373 (-) Transcript_12720:188-1306(-)|eukprot:CAMPEP_0197844794 /NCGR_PEP_ID=MMETSP1438-20131217/1778_1 /TAXON_ID=1461541 /ORGANISM="Pterosperma sp., Strain CCMP1384" /LENGTH=372 /DNA_ID=CAMNT_0043455775 /DNA_START=118 /DNA_END=1236 /DNA_ORIENTATION=+
MISLDVLEEALKAGPPQTGPASPTFLASETVRIPDEPRNQTEHVEDQFEVACSCARSGVVGSQGERSKMEDTYIALEDISDELRRRGLEVSESNGPQAYFGVFDGHGGTLAAEYVRDNLFNRIVSHELFPSDIEGAMHAAFLEVDEEFHSVQIPADGEEDFSGTTALVVFLINRVLYVANAGDCRCVLSNRGRAVELSTDQKPTDLSEVTRIKGKGGYIEDGYLNGLLGCSRAIGDWHLEMKEYVNGESTGPLTAEPEVLTREVREGDEFMVIACDGLWDVFSSQNAIEFARQNLRSQNDPQACSSELVKEALKRHTSDNVSVVTVCFTETPPPKRELVLSPSDKEKRGEGLSRTISNEGLAQLQRALSGQE